MLIWDSSANTPIDRNMKKLHKQANELLQAARKVYDYRRDVISSDRLNELTLAVTLNSN